MAENCGQKRKLLVDCDTGTDDAQALFMGLADPLVEISAITTVFGNTAQEHSCVNTLRVLKFCGRLDIPVYKGAVVTLLGNPYVKEHFHGEDGFGDVTLEGVDPVDTSMFQKEHAAVALGRMAAEAPGEYSLVMMGPLTNLALALHLDPNLGQNLKAVYVMGGSADGKGNITPAAEFNMYSDPEAAHFVFEKLGRIIHIATLDLCLKYSWSWDEYERFLEMPTEKVRFIKKIEAVKKEESEKLGYNKYVLCDQMAMAAALGDHVIQEVKDVYGVVELKGGVTRGQTIIDWAGQLKKDPNLRIITSMDKQVFNDMVLRGVQD